MDDPWAAPSWSTPAKPSSSSLPKGLSMTPPRSPTTLDVSDPWGAPPTSSMASMSIVGSVPSPQEMKAPETPGWGHESSWGTGDIPAPRIASPSSPTRQVTRLSPADENASWGGAMDLPSSSPPPRLSFDAAPPDDHFGSTSTPPQPFSALPNLSSPQTPHSAFSPHSHRSMTPTITHQPPDEEDPEAAFAAALPQTSTAADLPTFDIPKSPSFGEGDFGDFTSGLGDPWGGGQKIEWGGDEIREEEDRGMNDNGDEDAGEGWGNERSAAVETVKASGREEEDWEAAQRKIQLAESLVPHDKVDRLKKGWTQLAEGVIGLNKLQSPSENEISELESALRRLEIDRDETLRSLASIPSDINTYPPILSSFTTQTTYLSSLSRPHPSPATSFLIPNNKRPRRTETTDESSKPTAWLSRSRLGEPEIVAGETAPQEAESKTRWGFWGRRPTVERTLTTSGGGVLEVKTGRTSTELRKSTSQQSLGVPPTSSSANTSRPTSIFEAPIEIMPTPTTTQPTNLITTSPTSATSQPQPPPSATSAPMAQGPSAVSRFFGRWRQPSSTGTSQPDPSEDNAKDLELGEEDFSYLGQVPSFAPTPPPDLLDTHQRKTHEMASLESMIKSRPTPLPAPLAPPPLYSRSNSASGPSKGGGKRSDMDLLSGLYDDEDIGKASAPIVEAKKGNDPIGWNDFLGPTPSISTPIVPPPSRPSVPSHPSTSSDFGDFDAPPITSNLSQSNSGFDDFGDFSAFESPPPPPLPPIPSTTTQSSQRIPFLFTPSQPSAPPPTSYTSPLPILPQTKTPQLSFSQHRNRPSLDHTPALNLVNDASTTKGKRWPAPLSPDMPIIAPPSPGFPFLSPPPPGPSRPGSRMSDMMNDDSTSGMGGMGGMGERGGMGNGEGIMGIQQGLMSPVSVRPVQGQTLGPGISRSQTPVIMDSGGLGAGEKKVGVQGKGGLSAHDLSFFDNL